MLNRHFGIVICSRFVNCELWSFDMNSTLGSVVPFAMFLWLPPLGFCSKQSYLKTPADRQVGMKCCRILGPCPPPLFPSAAAGYCKCASPHHPSHLPPHSAQAQPPPHPPWPHRPHPRHPDWSTQIFSSSRHTFLLMKQHFLGSTWLFVLKMFSYNGLTKIETYLCTI